MARAGPLAESPDSASLGGPIGSPLAGRQVGQPSEGDVRTGSHVDLPRQDEISFVAGGRSATGSRIDMGSHTDPPSSGGFSVPHEPAAPDVPTQRTRSQHGVSKPKIRTDGTVRYDKHFGGLAVTGEPNNLSEAFESKNWKNAMDEE